MFFYLHYVLLTSGLSGVSVLLAVYLKTYTDASQTEIGALLMSMQFLSLFVKPIFCSIADRRQAHRIVMLIALIVEMAGFAPFALVPLFPDFYKTHPRISWYLLAITFHVGSAGLNVAWSLGDCLAVNYAQRTGTEFSHIRLMATLSWGFYGLILGLVNETPLLPKYLPVFLILEASLLIEVILLFFWDKQDFVLVDHLAIKHQESDVRPTSGQLYSEDSAQYNEQLARELEAVKTRAAQPIESIVSSLPSSLGGTLKVSPKAAKVMKDLFSPTDIELQHQLVLVANQQQSEQSVANRRCLDKQVSSDASLTGGSMLTKMNGTSPKHNGSKFSGKADSEAGAQKALATDRRIQFLLLKMIFREDGRFIKYVLLFSAAGILLAPTEFLYMNLEENCLNKGYNFSLLAGAALTSEAFFETAVFFILPSFIRHMSRCAILSFALLFLAARFIFYAGWYLTPGISPYWALVAEWSLGTSHGVFVIVQADIALMFANECCLFIPDLRRLGFLKAKATGNALTTPGVQASGAESDRTVGHGDGLKGEKLEAKKAQEVDEDAEERAIKIALRATMQALLGGFMNGLGTGSGSLLSGLIIQLYSFTTLWQTLSIFTCLSLAIYLFVEKTRSPVSDTYRPRKGTKAYEIMAQSRLRG